MKKRIWSRLKEKISAVRDSPPRCGPVGMKESIGEIERMAREETRDGWIGPDEEFEEEDFVLIKDKDMIKEA
ncbi:hypothetical protein L1987_07228 [Smallanthus sonchifolius]|uniref:Uncharacterized protein n=1 Tax=Smallanthus sonchifolius TaxID=185202 RepID=A0ACB9K032_9ASTR|nr:hypothetical protein L1987_07228 [Smallanthus sonchifolius]